MEIKIYQSMYKDMPCICMESSAVRAAFLPGQGAKLCSIRYIRTDKEFAFQKKGERYRKAYYGQSYLEGECAGIDEMFPNIDAFNYDDQPWEGTFLPDHGELWALEWDCVQKENAIIFQAHGVKLPYSIQKTVQFLDANTLSCSYEVHNHSPFPIHYIWAAHMMLEGEKGCMFEFPFKETKAYCTLSDSGTIGSYGDSFTYPFVQKADGSVYDIRLHRGNDANDYQKFYFAGKVPEGWGQIQYPDGHLFRIDFDRHAVPYLGAIQGEGGAFNIRCMFLEPCTGAFDNPVAAKQHGMNSVLPPNESAKWFLNIAVTKEEQNERDTTKIPD